MCGNMHAVPATNLQCSCCRLSNSATSFRSVLPHNTTLVWQAILAAAGVCPVHLRYTCDPVDNLHVACRSLDRGHAHRCTRACKAGQPRPQGAAATLALSSIEVWCSSSSSSARQDVAVRLACSSWQRDISPAGAASRVAAAAVLGGQTVCMWQWDKNAQQQGWTAAAAVQKMHVQQQGMLAPGTACSVQHWPPCSASGSPLHHAPQQTRMHNTCSVGMQTLPLWPFLHLTGR
jgi:hypothetical protein